MQNFQNVCSCKGQRSCLLCENSIKSHENVYQNQSSKTFYFSPQLKKCLCFVQCDGESSTTEIKQNVMRCVGFVFPGVTIFQEFISESEERELVKNIDIFPWKGSQSGRLKQDFGPKVNFKKQKIKLSTFNGLPSYISPIVKRMNDLKALEDFSVVEQCNLEYVPERGSHIDAHFDDAWLWGERLVTLNLLSDSFLTMTMNKDEIINLDDMTCAVSKLNDKMLLQKMTSEPNELQLNNISSKDIVIKIPLTQRSLTLLYGSARYEWKHAINRHDITSRRLCCTFRELSNQFSKNGEKCEVGSEILSIASSYGGNVVI